MKNKEEIRNLIFLITISLFIISCGEDYLSLQPQDRVGGELVWSDADAADLFLIDIYSYLPRHQIGYRKSETWTDNAFNTQWWQGSAERVRSGEMSPSNPIWGGNRDYDLCDWNWDWNFSYIRKCNVFIKNVRESDAFSDEYKNERIAEAKFLRAWFYVKLFKYYGAAPIITEPLDINMQGDEIFRPRASIQETAAFISNDCQEAADYLPLVQSEWGRATKGAALALKGYIELIAASPLNNPENNKMLWEKAATSYKKVIDLGIYQIMDYYHGLFLEENNRNAEMIFPKTCRYPRADRNTDDRFLEDCFGPAYAKIQPYGFVNYSIVTATPTQDLIDAYLMKDGKTIEESPLYDPDYPYENREPRFYESILYDGAPFRDGFIYTRKGDPYNAVDRMRQQWVTCTGYYMFKIYDERINGLLERPKGKVNYAEWPLIRFADVLLGYAEAQNEAVGPDASVLEAINKVRTRKDIAIPTVQETYGAVNQDKMREIIRNERRIELAFEDKRWVDLTRWKLGHKLQGYVRGVEPSMNTETGKMNYEYFNVVPQYFDTTNDKNYRFPIPLNLMEQNPQLEQNPGY
jgi:starch-binding outer membrane protein, SusD/RagB family